MSKIVFFKSIRPADDKERLGAKPGEDAQEPAGDASAAAQKPAPAQQPQAAEKPQQKPEGEPSEGEGEGEQGEFGPHNVEAGHHVAFHAGEFKGAGKVTAAGEDGCTVADKSGREHRVHWHEVKGHHDGAKAD